jgi:hypothetical protein
LCVLLTKSEPFVTAQPKAGDKRRKKMIKRKLGLAQLEEHDVPCVTRRKTQI